MVNASRAASRSRPGAPARCLSQRFLGELPAIVERLGGLYRAEVPAYAELSADVVRDEVLPVTRSFVQTFFSALAEGRSPNIAEMPDLEATGRRRLEMGVPLEAMLHVYRIAGRGVFEAIVELMEPGEDAALREIAPWWMDFVDHASHRTALGYLHASQDQIRRVEARRAAVLQALLACEGPAEVAGVAAEFSLTLARAYVPAVTSGDGAADRIDALVAASPPGALVGSRGRVVLVLSPEALSDASGLLRVVGRRPIVVGRPSAPGSGLRAELEHAERVLDIAAARGLSGVYTPRDLLLEQLVVGSPRVAEQLGHDVLAPLAGADRSGLLVSTLRTYLRTGSVAETADREAAHPNTVTYRLRRVTDLTGFDARVPQEAAVLALALACPPPEG